MASSKQASEMSSVVESVGKFAVDLHKVLQASKKSAGQNLFYSPASLCVALGMVYAGARGATAQELATGLHWEGANPTDAAQHQQIKDLSNALNKPGAKNKLSIANNLFLQKDFSVLLEFTELCEKFYDAKTALVDYQKDCEGARKEVNDWVEKKTNGTIRDLIAEGVFTSQTRLTLVNAIYFKGLWEKQFKKEHTYDSQFHTSKSQQVDMKMMFQKSKFRYRHNDSLGYKVLEMPYIGGQVSMVVILPDEIEGLAKFEQNLTHEKLQEALSVSSARQLDVEVSIPKFKMTQEFKLNDMLRKLGMSKMFSEFEADFSGISPPPVKLYVSAVIHKAFVEVNEEGTEAAAATAAVMNMRCAIIPRDPIEFIADHPFLFLIRHCQSNSILFMGLVMNPVA